MVAAASQDPDENAILNQLLNKEGLIDRTLDFQSVSLEERKTSTQWDIIQTEWCQPKGQSGSAGILLKYDGWSLK